MANAHSLSAMQRNETTQWAPFGRHSASHGNASDERLGGRRKNLAAFLASDKAGYVMEPKYVIDGGMMHSYHEQ